MSEEGKFIKTIEKVDKLQRFCNQYKYIYTLRSQGWKTKRAKNNSDRDFAEYPAPSFKNCRSFESANNED